MAHGVHTSVGYGYAPADCGETRDNGEKDL